MERRVEQELNMNVVFFIELRMLPNLLAGTKIVHDFHSIVGSIVYLVLHMFVRNPTETENQIFK